MSWVKIQTSNGGLKQYIAHLPLELVLRIPVEMEGKVRFFWELEEFGLVKTQSKHTSKVFLLPKTFQTKVCTFKFYKYVSFVSIQ